MSSVANELAALRAKGGGVKARAAGLDNGATVLSTPEAEAAALKAKREKDRRDKLTAKTMLNKGGSGVDQELERTLQQQAKKKAEQEAKKLLEKGSIDAMTAVDTKEASDELSRKRLDILKALLQTTDDKDYANFLSFLLKD